MLAFALTAAAPVRYPEVVGLVRENYALYAEAKSEVDPAAWRRLETSARSGEPEAIRSYLFAFRDPSLRITEPPAKLKERFRVPHAVRIGGGPEPILFLGGTRPEPSFTPRWSVPAFTGLNEAEFEAALSKGDRLAILDIRSSAAETTPNDRLLDRLLIGRSVRDSGTDVRVGAGSLAAWRRQPTGLLGGASTLNRMSGARGRGFVFASLDRILPISPRRGGVRVAILVGPDTLPAAGRFADLARRGPSVRVFGSETGPIGDRGLRRLPLSAGATIDVPTFRRRGANRVVPDEEFESLPPELRELPTDLVRFRADQWCRLGE